MAEGKKVQKKKVTAGGRVTPKGGAADAVDDALVEVDENGGAATPDPADKAKETKSKGPATDSARPALTSVNVDQSKGTRARQSGRVTEKGSTGDGKPPPSTRYTPPADRTIEMPSPWYIPAVMFTLWGLGLLMIFLNYVELLPGAQSNWYLLGGLGAILAGIIVATQYR